MKKLILFILLSCSAAWATTGGSMGGGSFSGGSHSSSSSSSGGYHSSSSYSGGGGSTMSDSEAIGWLVLFGVGGSIALVVWWIGAVKRAKADGTAGTSNLYGSVHGDDVDVSVVRIVVDGRSRKFVQTELARIAKIANTATPEGRVTMLREVALTLRRLRDAWVYGGAVNENMRDIGAQQQVFTRWADDARSKFREETIRNEGGVQTATPASQYTPRYEQGDGLILVSLIIAARRELFTIRDIAHGEDLRNALESIGTLDANTLVAVEVVWQPSEDSDRMSSMQLETMYPPPQVVRIAGALVGKVFCSFCGGPFPAELVSCPHCGAPAPGRAA